jgi:hypothetical protein
MIEKGHNFTSGIRYRIPVMYSEPSPLIVFALVPTPIRLYLAMMLGLDVVKTRGIIGEGAGACQ